MTESELQGARARLRRLAPGDLQALVDIARQPGVQPWWTDTTESGLKAALLSAPDTWSWVVMVDGVWPAPSQRMTWGGRRALRWGWLLFWATRGRMSAWVLMPCPSSLRMSSANVACIGSPSIRPRPTRVPSVHTRNLGSGVSGSCARASPHLTERGATACSWTCLRLNSSTGRPIEAVGWSSIRVSGRTPLGLLVKRGSCASANTQHVGRSRSRGIQVADRASDR